MLLCSYTAPVAGASIEAPLQLRRLQQHHCVHGCCFAATPFPSMLLYSIAVATEEHPGGLSKRRRPISSTHHPVRYTAALRAPARQSRWRAHLHHCAQPATPLATTHHRPCNTIAARHGCRRSSGAAAYTGGCSTCKRWRTEPCGRGGRSRAPLAWERPRPSPFAAMAAVTRGEDAAAAWLALRL